MSPWEVSAVGAVVIIDAVFDSSYTDGDDNDIRLLYW